MWESFREKKVKINYIAPSFSHGMDAVDSSLMKCFFPRSAEDPAIASLMLSFVVLKGAHESA